MLHLYTTAYDNVWEMHHQVLNGQLSTKELKSTTKRDICHGNKVQRMQVKARQRAWIGEKGA